MADRIGGAPLAPRTMGFTGRGVATAAACALLAAASLAILPRTALAANFLTDPIGWLDELISSPVREAFAALFDNWITPLLNDLADSAAADAAIRIPTDAAGFHSGDAGNFKDIDMLYVAWGTLFGPGSSVYARVRPLGQTVLAIVFGLQTIKVAREPDQGSSGIPYFEKFAWLGIRFALLKFLLDYSVDLATLAFNAVNDSVTATILSTPMASVGGAVMEGANLTTLTGTVVVEAMWGALSGGFLAAVLAVGLQFLIIFLIVGAMDIVAKFAVMARFLQLFCYLVFAPIFFALAGLDETKPMFVSYVKSMFSMSLSFAMTVLVLRLTPVIFVSQLANTLKDGAPLTGLLSTVAVGIVLIMALTKAGAWAHDLIGG